MLHEVADGLPEAGADKVGRVTQENGASGEGPATLGQVCMVVFILRKRLEFLLDLSIRWGGGSR